MKTIFTLVCTSLFLSSCYRLGYLGSSYPATQNVEVYVDPAAIKKPYVVMGKSTVSNAGPVWRKDEHLQKQAVALASKKGADAILFGDVNFRYQGSSIQQTTTTDSVGRGSVIVSTGNITPAIVEQRIIYYLKYQ